MQRVLIVESSREAPPGAVEQALAKRGAACAVLSLADVCAGRGAVSFRIGPDRRPELVFSDARSGAAVSTKEIASTWVEDFTLPPNPGTVFDPSKAGPADVIAAAGATESWTLALTIVGILARVSRLLPPAGAAMKHARRPAQQEAARQAGFRALPVYAGTDAHRMFRHFGGGEDAAVHYQPLAAGSFSLEGRTFVAVSRFLGRNRRFALFNLKAPALFSLWPREWRRFNAAVLDGEVELLEVAAADASLDPDVTDPDYQGLQDNRVLRPAPLPPGLRDLILGFAARTGLSFGSVEFLESPVDPGAPFFLEADGAARLHLLRPDGPLVGRIVDRLLPGERP